MQIILDSNCNSKFVEFLIEYLQLNRFVGLNVIKFEDFTVNSELIRIPSYPILFLKNGSSLLSIEKIVEYFLELLNLSNVFSLPSGIEKYQNLVSTMKFEELLLLINKTLIEKTFLESDTNIKVEDLYVYFMIKDKFKDFDDTNKYIYNGVYRWVNHIQELPSISSVIAKLSIPKTSQINMEKVIMKKVKLFNKKNNIE